MKSIQIGIVNGNVWIDDVQIGEASGWTGEINGVTDPTSVNGVAVSDIDNINGVDGAT